MSTIDPFAPLRDWQIALYRGDAHSIDRFLSVIDTILPPGWIRDGDYERSRRRPDKIYCYLFEKPGEMAARLLLQRVTLTRVRGQPIQLLRHPSPGNEDRIGRLVADFVAGCILPAARSIGICHTYPAFGLRSVITGVAERLFDRVADRADGKWPLPSESRDLWDELVATCLAEQVAIDRADLYQWLRDSGWEAVDSVAIVEQFFQDSELLANRLTVTAQ